MKKENGFLKEFREFIMRGNVMDMAVGVIVGGAFTAIVTSLNEDILSPILAIFGGVDFSELQVKFGDLPNAPVLHYGNFITAVINFIITALVIFLIIRGLNRFNNHVKELDAKIRKTEEEEVAATEKECPYCLSKIPVAASKCKYCTSDQP